MNLEISEEIYQKAIDAYWGTYRKDLKHLPFPIENQVREAVKAAIEEYLME